MPIIRTGIKKSISNGFGAKKLFSKFRENVTFFVTKAAPGIYARIVAVFVPIDRPMNLKVITGVHWFSIFVPWRVWERRSELKTGKTYQKTRFWHISKIISLTY